ncbi:hypothetical protein BISU_1019 [Bifidobacterium subtile]|jgi:hypothetical protein|uniref:Uncharacterized protein n=1 Tax=Bifidobacterium subtile TaxID=77635 RepID=A0A087E5N9_9BIFI|nr:hypothetical protein BISU_1019 [Bifidobacterium subtile]
MLMPCVWPYLRALLIMQLQLASLGNVGESLPVALLGKNTNPVE